MTEYSVVQEHTADNITLLCGYHHDMKTRGQIPDVTIRSFNSNPHNKSSGETARHQLFYYGDYAEVVIGGNVISATGKDASAIRIDGHSLISMELVDGNIVFNLDFFDAAGKPVLTVKRNELVHSTHLWDYSFSGQTLKIRERRGQVFLNVVFSPETHRVIIDQGFVSHNGVDLLFNTDGFCILNNRILLSGTAMHGIDTAISVGESSGSDATTGIQVDIDRGPYDRKAAIAWARQNMKISASRSTTSGAGPQYVSSRALGSQSYWFSIAAQPYPWTKTTCATTRKGS